MNRSNRGGRWTIAWLAVGLLLLVGLGCSPMSLWHVMRGGEWKDAEHPLTPHDGKKDVTVAIAVTAPADLLMNPDTSGIDFELAAKIGSQLTALAEANKDSKIKVIDQSKVTKYRQSDPNRWNTAKPSQLAKGLGADYLIDVDLSSFSLYDKQAFATYLPKGSASATVSVFEAGNQGEPTHTYSLVSNDNLRDTTSMPAHLYRGEFLGKLATELALKHVKHTADQERAAKK